MSRKKNKETKRNVVKHGDAMTLSIVEKNDKMPSLLRGMTRVTEKMRPENIIIVMQWRRKIRDHDAWCENPRWATT